MNLTSKKCKTKPLLARKPVIIVVCTVALALAVVAALLWFPPLYQSNYAPLDATQPFFVQQEHDLVNLNTASAAELTILPGIGETRAQAIVDWREANGPFASVDALQQVKGIGPSVFAGLEHLVCVE